MQSTITNTEKQTYDFGFAFAKDIKAGSVIALTGDLGVGKTIFVKGLAKALGIDEHILSPTFTLLRQYNGLNHFDVYRIDDQSELSEIGFSEFLEDENITVIEWANLIYDILPPNIIYINISRTANEGQRKISVSDEVIQ
jgi:tRNA threonylcarbamoyladenosine biosynthesis protein TsaE